MNALFLPHLVADQQEATRSCEIHSHDFLHHIARSKSKILLEHGDPLAFCESLIAGKTSALSQSARQTFEQASFDLRDYLIASCYALLIGEERRKELSAYFTPPALCSAVLDAARPFFDNRQHARVLDPACGGGAFLVPVARYLVKKAIAQGRSTSKAAQITIERLRGFELDAGLAAISRKLIAAMFKREFGVMIGREARAVVKEADTLAETLPRKFDLVIGNPPYGRIRDRVHHSIAAAAGRAHFGGHTNFYSLFLLKSLDTLRPGGGLIFVLPTSFVAGPYFSGLRQEILDRAAVVRLDLHQDRENLFLGAVQDVCLLVLQKHGSNQLPLDQYEIGIIDSTGKRRVMGAFKTSAAGEPWTLPVDTSHNRSQPRSIANGQLRHFTLADYGYRIRVGKVVPTRERAALRTRPSAHTLPLIWASAVRPDGSFEAEGGQKSKNSLWFRPPKKDVSYATKVPSVIVQRTSNREQARRLNAAAVTPKFLEENRQYGFVAENHVIVLEVTSPRPRVPPALLVKILNSEAANERFSAVSGSFSVSAKLLARLALPDPALLPSVKDKYFTRKLSTCFSSIDGVLVPLATPDGAQNTVN